MKFWIFVIFNETFLNSRYEYANEWVDDVIASQFSMYFAHRNDKNPIFQLWKSRTCLISTLNKCRIIIAQIYFDMRTCFYMFEQQKTTKNTWKIVRRWWHHQLTNLHIHINCSRNVWLKIKKIHSCLRYFLSDLHQIVTVLFKMFYSLYWINLNSDRSSPLKCAVLIPYRARGSLEVLNAPKANRTHA